MSKQQGGLLFCGWKSRREARDGAAGPRGGASGAPESSRTAGGEREVAEWAAVLLLEEQVRGWGGGGG